MALSSWTISRLSRLGPLLGLRRRHCYRRESFVGAGGESGREYEGEVEECGEVAGHCRRRHHVGFQVDLKPLSLLTFSCHSLFIWVEFVVFLLDF